VAQSAPYVRSQNQHRTSVEVSDAYSNDYTHFKALVDQTAQNGFKMAEISADKGYIGATNLLTSLQHGAMPYIPFKINAKAKASTYGAKSRVWDKLLGFYTDNREEFLQHYHKRSNVETVFHMIKAKFGQRLRSKTLIAQTNELLCKVLCHNLCVVIQSQHELGIETDFSNELAA
jgi:transposase